MSTPYPPEQPTSGSQTTGNQPSHTGSFAAPPQHPSWATQTSQIRATGGETSVPLVIGWIFTGLCLLVGLVMLLTAEGYSSSSVSSALIGVGLMFVGAVSVTIMLGVSAVISQLRSSTQRANASVAGSMQGLAGALSGLRQQ